MDVESPRDLELKILHYQR